MDFAADAPQRYRPFGAVTFEAPFLKKHGYWSVANVHLVCDDSRQYFSLLGVATCDESREEFAPEPFQFVFQVVTCEDTDTPGYIGATQVPPLPLDALTRIVFNPIVSGTDDAGLVMFEGYDIWVPHHLWTQCPRWQKHLSSQWEKRQKQLPTL